MGELGLNVRNKNFKQGIYKPINKEKFVSKTGYAIYRSGLELEYFRKLDNNPNVVKWGSEEVVIPYFFEEKWHKYYVDLFIITKDNKKYLVELKPWKQTQEPKWSKRRKREIYLKECYDYAKNKAKWMCAIESAKKFGYEFRIWTEKDLNQHN